MSETELIRKEFEKQFPAPEGSGIEWYPEREAYLTRIPMFQSMAKGRTDAFVGWCAAWNTRANQPRPAVQRDVSGLVEALECILSMDDEIQIVDVMDSKAREMVEIARDALAAYRSRGEV